MSLDTVSVTGPSGELMKRVQLHRELVAQLRAVAPGMSLPEHRALLIEDALYLEREANELESRAYVAVQQCSLLTPLQS